MNLFEQIHKGIELVERGKALGKDTGPVEHKVRTLQSRLNNEIEQLKLSEFERRDAAVEVYLEALSCSVWFCSNDVVALKLISDEPEAITYTTDELIEIIYLNPCPEALRTILEAKSIFPSSRLIDSKRCGPEDSTP